MSGAIAISITQGAVLPALSLSQAGFIELAATQIESLPSIIIISQGTSIAPAPSLSTNPLGSNPHASWTFQSGGWVEYALPDTVNAWGLETSGAILLEDGEGRLLMED